MLNDNSVDDSYCILDGPPTGRIENLWRACLADSDFPTHYAAPEFFLEPALRDKRPFAVLNLVGKQVTAVITGVYNGDHLQSGLPVRPQIAFSRHADRSRAVTNLIAGILRQAKSAKLVDLYLWSDMAELVDTRFHQKGCEGVVMLDLSQGPDALFRRFSQTRRNDIRRAIKLGVRVDVPKNDDDVSAYYRVYSDWARRKALPLAPENELKQTLTLTKNRRLFLAWHESQLIGGTVVRFFPGGVVEYAANCSLHTTLHLRPNDLLQWRVIEWACSQGMTKYSLGGAHLFSRKSGGNIAPTTRHRLDRSLLRQYAIGDWFAESTKRILPFVPKQVVDVGRSCWSYARRLRA
jgi:hypothetical protein